MADFHRIKRLPPYVFEQVNRIKAAARNNGADIIDLGMGNPDLPAPRHVIEKMIETVGKPRTDRYSASKGVVVGMTMTARQPSLWALSATPWAWLPADAQITPLARCSGLNCTMRL